MLYSWVKVFHIVFMVSWMAGLFYLPRLFVYHAESRAEDDPRRAILGAQFTVMERRLYTLIMRPAMWITWVTGASLVLMNQAFLHQPWLWLKVFLVALLTAYHVTCGRTISAFARGDATRSGEWYRVFNEAPTLVLVLAVALVILKNAITPSSLGAVLIGTIVAVVAGYRIYAVARRRDSDAPID